MSLLVSYQEYFRAAVVVGKQTDFTMGLPTVRQVTVRLGLGCAIDESGSPLRLTPAGEHEPPLAFTPQLSSCECQRSTLVLKTGLP